MNNNYIVKLKYINKFKANQKNVNKQMRNNKNN